MKIKNLYYYLILILTYSFIITLSCENIITLKKYSVIFDNSQNDNTDDNTNDSLSNANTIAAFWGLPGITFKNWRPNIHIKASTDNGNLENRVWEPDASSEPDPQSLFEYSQIVFYESNYKDIDPEKDATVDNNVLMNLAFEQKLYKRSWYELNKYDVSYDFTEKAVVITLNTENSNYFVLKKGARIAVIATQRPAQWGENNDYTIIDSIPACNSLQKSPLSANIKDNTADRSITRVIDYITYDGGTQTITDTTWDNHWFKGLKLEEEKITIYMPKLTDGNTAKTYWDSIDKVPIKPFMLFWITIQQ
ncbi:MAG TPA: hypothetical protein PLE45_09440 [Spirochaetota bacterium]|nr:hypothetical protein [Spirochaetota bacterium]HOL57335.1 hypothetical protein [Spirochaetota bacterium]HPP04880.1 hypothetical protein [Spirochaetota bacterium]